MILYPAAALEGRKNEIGTILKSGCVPASCTTGTQWGERGPQEGFMHN